ncbi:sensor histidine kinase [Chitinophaga sancti]|uniref:histidine kinase n=1 Tax=Chitinophaga sancti TaxID=1004 RepID=A0A1K1SZ59_9BACT|nr:ATP-binding protein [Chitinophaga sancti]WQD63642.1 ATP-binding protein [Chitinophaga sancti]WQG90733.1 ATP-binding protein [Chitinophaga sancti]SFW89640.1 PAS domain S-box-containing protein [Chitinophaga sancti]
MRLKTKLSIGIGFLFTAILVSGLLGIFSINLMKKDAHLVLKDNYETLVYSNNMLQTLEQFRTDPQSIAKFEENLSRQEANITEPGEGAATGAVRALFEQLKKAPSNDSLQQLLRDKIYLINTANQQAIFSKNNTAMNNAKRFSNWLVLIFSMLSIIAFTLAVNFPGIISEPINALSEGIKSIVNKDYSRRIHLNQQDEFGELAQAFNTMAEKLNEYEHSNLAKIKFEKSRIDTIINQMNDGIIGIDDTRHILFANRVAEKLLGLKEIEIAGKYAPDVALQNDLMRSLLQETSKEKELKIFADNKESYFHLDVINVDNNERVIGQVIVLRNITPFHELNEAKTNFIATISHELKTPIASIKMSAQLLADHRVGAVNKEQDELIKSITDDSDRLLKITSELLNMSQVETGHIQLKIAPVSPGIIIGNATSTVSFLAQQKNIRVRVEEADTPCKMLTDPEKTAWVLTNFLTNAVKYSPEDDEIVLKTFIKEQRIYFTVTDHGRGIDEKYLPKIFDRYFKVPGTPEKAGTGLGLSISREFIEAQGGRIWVESRLGEGAEFGFWLPVV